MCKSLSPLTERFFVIPTDVETVNLRSLQINLWANEGSDPPFANSILQEVGDLNPAYLSDIHIVGCAVT
jgi:hypothetical protein